VYQNGKLHVVTDGGPNETAYLATIDPNTWERKTILNNFHERPFMSFNDLEMDKEGNYYLTDSRSGWVCITLALSCIKLTDLIVIVGPRLESL